MHSLNLLWGARNEQHYERRQKNVWRRKIIDNVNNMPDLLFIERFRLDKPTFRTLCNNLRTSGLKGTKEIPLELKVLCALSFLATGSYQRIVGVSQHLPQRSASRCIREVVDVLNSPNIVNNWISFPQSREARSLIKQEFLRKFGLPGVIGCIDCTHIALVQPSHEEQLFFNRKGYHSLNVQMICDSNLRITNVNAKFGGATHDAYIWSSSQIEPYLRGLHRNSEHVWLLGDSGYPLRPWLMTPILHAASGSPEDLYTRRHIKARNCVERCFGVLKSRWRCLLKDRTLHYHPIVASKITIACCVLHNIAINSNLPPPELVNITEESGNAEFYSPSMSDSISNTGDLLQGRALQNRLVSGLN